MAKQTRQEPTELGAEIIKVVVPAALDFTGVNTDTEEVAASDIDTLEVARRLGKPMETVRGALAHLYEQGFLFAEEWDGNGRDQWFIGATVQGIIWYREQNTPDPKTDGRVANPEMVEHVDHVVEAAYRTLDRAAKQLEDVAATADGLNLRVLQTVLLGMAADLRTRRQDVVLAGKVEKANL